jgi:hypothetical protein
MKVFYSIALLFLIFQFHEWKANGYYVYKKISKNHQLKLKFKIFFKAVFFLIDEIDDNENSKVLHEFKIELSNENKDKKRSLKSKDIIFPDEFSIRFNKFDREINAKFSKLNKNSKSEQLSNADIYVIDESTGQPKLYQIDENNKVIQSKIHLLVKLFFSYLYF